MKVFASHGKHKSVGLSTREDLRKFLKLLVEIKGVAEELQNGFDDAFDGYVEICASFDRYADSEEDFRKKISFDLHFLFFAKHYSEFIQTNADVAVMFGQTSRYLLQSAAAERDLRVDLDGMAKLHKGYLQYQHVFTREKRNLEEEAVVFAWPTRG